MNGVNNSIWNTGFSDRNIGLNRQDSDIVSVKMEIVQDKLEYTRQITESSNNDE